MRTVFFNGPVQNGSFTFEENPGKGVGIWIAAALNELLAVPPAPHLWNTVTMTGDLRFRNEPDHGLRARHDYEALSIARKYGEPGPPHVMTDADQTVADTALQIIDNGLVSGELCIREEAVTVCTNCGHMTGHNATMCKACGRTGTRSKTGKQLIAVRDPSRPVLDRDDIHAVARRQPVGVQCNASHVPARLLLSRTRHHGISLAPFGLKGLVLDPRAGLHATVVAAARAADAQHAVMTITDNALINIAAYGQAFRHLNETHLKYALHGRIPYPQLDAAPDPLITRWFLPLAALDLKSGVNAVQFSALLVYLRRTIKLTPAVPSPDALAEIRRRIALGDTKWITSRHLLAQAIAVHLSAWAQASRSSLHGGTLTLAA
jgi:RNA polymerase subunit RPABC4/transcription elongation factor Spt4